MLAECAKVKGIWRVLSRTDILEKVKQYDAKLTNALQVFQVRFYMEILDIHRTNFNTGPGGAW